MIYTLKTNLSACNFCMTLSQDLDKNGRPFLSSQNGSTKPIEISEQRVMTYTYYNLTNENIVSGFP